MSESSSSSSDYINNVSENEGYYEEDFYDNWYNRTTSSSSESSTEPDTTEDTTSFVSNGSSSATGVAITKNIDRDSVEEYPIRFRIYMNNRHIDNIQIKKKGCLVCMLIVVNLFSTFVKNVIESVTFGSECKCSWKLFCIMLFVFTLLFIINVACISTSVVLIIYGI